MRRVLLIGLKLAIAAALLVWVSGKINWSDQLQISKAGPDQGPLLIDGELHGDWAGPDWRFDADDGQVYSAPHDPGLRPRPSFPRLMKQMELSWFLGGCVLWGVLVLLAAARWKLLLGAVEVPTHYLHSLRLVLIGIFFNNLMLGTTGGDVARALMRTRGMQERRWRAVVSVAVDRLTGLFALLLLAANALIAARMDDNLGQMRMVWIASWVVFAMLFALTAFAVVYASPQVRALLMRLPLLRKSRLPAMLRGADEAGLAFRSRRRVVAYAVLISLPLQVAGILAFWCFGQALDSPLRALDAFLTFPPVQSASALPIAPAGWGLGETLYGWFHARILGGPEWFTMGVATSVLFRLTTQVGFGLVGGAVWVLSRQEGRGIANTKS